MAYIQIKSLKDFSNLNNDFQQQIRGGIDYGGSARSYFGDLSATSEERIEFLWSGFFSGRFNTQVSNSPDLQGIGSRYVSGTYLIFTLAENQKDGLSQGDYIGTVQIN